MLNIDVHVTENEVILLENGEFVTVPITEFDFSNAPMVADLLEIVDCPNVVSLLDIKE